MIKLHTRNGKHGYYCEFFDGESWKLTFLPPAKAFLAVLATGGDYFHIVDEANLIFESKSP
jgi:hypothetical protein